MCIEKLLVLTYHKVPSKLMHSDDRWPENWGNRLGAYCKQCVLGLQIPVNLLSSSQGIHPIPWK
jgi:hypothetical protein